jgi:hypothetical protein
VIFDFGDGDIEFANVTNAAAVLSVVGECKFIELNVGVTEVIIIGELEDVNIVFGFGDCIGGIGVRIGVGVRDVTVDIFIIFIY